MKRLSKILTLLILVYSIASIFSACAKDPYKDYVSSGLEPKTKKVEYSEQNFEKWNNDFELRLLTSFADYEKFEVDLGYTKEYFELNSLLIFLRTTCSSENHQFVDVLEKDGKLCPVLEHNYIGPDDSITADIIYLVFYVEVPNSGNYTAGEVIYKIRTENKEELPQSVLCGLEEAYTKGLISKDDLRSIAYYYNGKDAATDFVPTPKNPESLSEDTIKKIQRAYYDKVGGEKTEAVVDDVNIGGYYGTYDGCVIVYINASCMSGIGGDPICYPEYAIEDVVFYWYTPLQVWKEIGV